MILRNSLLFWDHPIVIPVHQSRLHSAFLFSPLFFFLLNSCCKRVRCVFNRPLSYLSHLSGIKLQLAFIFTVGSIFDRQQKRSAIALGEIDASGCVAIIEQCRLFGRANIDAESQLLQRIQSL